MNLYLLTQDDVDDYDTYDSAVVCAVSEEDAVTIYPSDYGEDWSTSEYRSWALTPDLVKAEYLGQAHSNLKRGVVLASFNAG
tara:strand:+ start:1054 stop:1299 length:246 start_codon:yes stop_codon:yes gene_type:complete